MDSAAPGLARAYHQRSKHHLQRYAAGPETLDWDAQPDPFRRWAGAPLTPLPLAADALPTRWAELGCTQAPQPLTLAHLGALFELSFGLTAWKQHGPDRWALRANPSSGNLHPTEAYLLTAGLGSLSAGLYHYAPHEHALELRAELHAETSRPHGVANDVLWVGLSSVQWREAWKYGERAFRYCQLDTGHALGALRYAAAALGWQAQAVPGLGSAELAALLGLDRCDDFGAAEAEEPELLVRITPRAPASADTPTRPTLAATRWHGRANQLDAHPMYRWPVIDAVASATREPPAEPGKPADLAPVAHPARTSSPAAQQASAAIFTAPARAQWPAATLIRQRRSAQHFDRHARLPREAFFRLVAALQPEGLPWDAWPHAPAVQMVAYAHRVEGLAPGAYLLPRGSEGEAACAGLLAGSPLAEAPAGLPLRLMAAHSGLPAALRTLSCHQAIASDACVAFSLLGRWGPALDTQPWRYRQLLQEAGLMGQALYLQAEAEGFRGTGIGCFFDDAVHELLHLGVPLGDTPLQVLYHFTVGVPLADARVSVSPPYAERKPVICHD